MYFHKSSTYIFWLAKRRCASWNGLSLNISSCTSMMKQFDENMRTINITLTIVTSLSNCLLIRLTWSTVSDPYIVVQRSINLSSLSIISSDRMRTKQKFVITSILHLRRINCSLAVSFSKPGDELMNDCIDVYIVVIISNALLGSKDEIGKHLMRCRMYGIVPNLSCARIIFESNIHSEFLRDRFLSSSFDVDSCNTG
jgi:hypothetical protein